MLINRGILLKALLLSSLVTVSLYGESYKQIYNKYILRQSEFHNIVGEYSFHELVDGFDFTKSNFVICKRNYIKINTIRGRDTITYIRNHGHSYILTGGKTNPVKNRVDHWTDLQLPRNGEIIGESMVYNVMCYHVLSDNMELWIDEKDDVPIMIQYRGRVSVKVIIPEYIEIRKGLLFPAGCTIFVNDKFYSSSSIRDFKYTGG